VVQSTEKINVLDKGFVRLVDFMGGDDRAVQAARVSFGAVSKGPEQDKRLIKYLMEHAHHTPFEHCYFQFHICCPIYVARQWMRHRWGSYNEVSARYTEVKDEFYIPASFRGQDTKNKQGSVRIPHWIMPPYLKSMKKALKHLTRLTKNCWKPA